MSLADVARASAPVVVAFVVYPVLTGLLNWVLWWDTPARWDAFVAAHPKRARLVRILRAAHPHVRKVVELWRDTAATRSSLPMPTAPTETPQPPQETP